MNVDWDRFLDPIAFQMALIVLPTQPLLGFETTFLLFVQQPDSWIISINITPFEVFVELNS